MTGGAPPRRGDIYLVRLRFGAADARSDDSRASKRRPCVVVAFDGDWAAVRPIHGTNTAVRRTGCGVRLRDWKEAGIHKPSMLHLDGPHRPALGHQLPDRAPYRV